MSGTTRVNIRPNLPVTSIDLQGLLLELSPIGITNKDFHPQGKLIMLEDFDEDWWLTEEDFPDGCTGRIVVVLHPTSPICNYYHVHKNGLKVLVRSVEREMNDQPRRDD